MGAAFPSYVARRLIAAGKKACCPSGKTRLGVLLEYVWSAECLLCATIRTKVARPFHALIRLTAWPRRQSQRTNDAQVEAHVAMYTAEAEEQLLDGGPDFVLDAIDNIDTKVRRAWDFGNLRMCPRWAIKK